MDITIIKSSTTRSDKVVNRYQVFEGKWDPTQPLPTPAKLTYSYRKAMEIAGKILARKYVQCVNTDKDYKPEDIVHAEIPSTKKESK